jgi:predicted transcriptional regulator
MRALLSIRPQYVSAIISGEKKFEFRRTIFKHPVEIVVIYASSPIQRAVAEFEVKNVFTENLENLWQRTHKYAGIERQYFIQYFHGNAIGHAIEIGKVIVYRTPYCIREKLGMIPPQSFAYLHRYPRTIS